MAERFQTKKSLGQHFLASAAIPRIMCDAARVEPGDVVVEIGPGTGVLTAELLFRGAHVIALEADSRAIDVLRERFAKEVDAETLTLLHADVREMDLQAIARISDHSFKVVANIPYYLSGLLFRSFLESALQPSTLVFLVQKEVAKRIAAAISKGEKESILSLSVKAYGTIRYVKTVSKGHFNPPPKVDSAVIAIEDINREHFTDLDERFFFELLHQGFGSKRKQLMGNLTKTFDRDLLTHIFSTVSLPVSVRAEDVPLEKWLSLAKLLSIHGK